jgi:hypothetical protein
MPSLRQHSSDGDRSDRSDEIRQDNRLASWATSSAHVIYGPRCRAVAALVRYSGRGWRSAGRCGNGIQARALYAHAEKALAGLHLQATFFLACLAAMGT